MHELKFRVWCKYTNNFLRAGRGEEWGEEFNMFYNLGVPRDLSWILNNPDRYAVTQYIGLKDKFGNDIYSGDIVNFVTRGMTHSHEPQNYSNEEVWYDTNSMAFMFGRKEHHSYYAHEITDIEITNNIFGNSTNERGSSCTHQIQY